MVFFFMEVDDESEVKMENCIYLFEGKIVLKVNILIYINFINVCLIMSVYL